MANDGIRLPSDTTVASQKVHRGSHAQDTQVIPANPKEVAQPKTLLTVVLQSKPLIEGAKGGLFELMLQNDPRTAPPITLRSDTLISPGTSLLLELDEQGVYRPVERPSRAQLTQLIQLELDFWRAHLLPKSGRRAFPTIPDSAILTRLGTQFSELKPLTDWLSQRPANLSGQEVRRWIQELSPLSQLRPWSTSAPAQASPAAIQSGSTHPNIVPAQTVHPAPHPALTQAIGLRVEPPTVALLQGLVPAATSKDMPTLQLAGQWFSIRSDASVQGIPANILHSSLSPVRFRPLSSAPQGNPAMTPQSPAAAATATHSATSSPIIAHAGLSQTTTQPGPIQLNLVPMPTAAGAGSNSTLQLVSSAATPTALPAPALPSALTPTTTNLPVPALTQRSTELPLEMKLGLWLLQLDKTTAQHPTAVQSQLQSKAEDALRQLAAGQQPPGQPVTNSQSTDQSSDESSLLALRNWLDSTLARIQNNAVQTAAAQISQPEQPVQQMQLPLIWLGLTSWADVEWWQQTPKKDKQQKERKENQQRRWRMRLYLTLTPLGKVCADLDWGTDQTQLTFWSEDPATLNHLNQLLPTLNQWTEGLGERQLTTKHGMPQRQNEHQDDEPSHHLVDIKT